jgi:hypothetical protein
MENFERFGGFIRHCSFFGSTMYDIDKREGASI